MPSAIHREGVYDSKSPILRGVTVGFRPLRRFPCCLRRSGRISVQLADRYSLEPAIDALVSLTSPTADMTTQASKRNHFLTPDMQSVGISGISTGFPVLSQSSGRLLTVVLTRSYNIHSSSCCYRWARSASIVFPDAASGGRPEQDQTLHRDFRSTPFFRRTPKSESHHV